MYLEIKVGFETMYLLIGSWISFLHNQNPERSNDIIIFKITRFDWRRPQQFALLLMHLRVAATAFAQRHIAIFASGKKLQSREFRLN